jgi:formamidopyrimidine-DNA glycosylase
MTGQLRGHAADDAVQPHTHLTFALDDGRELRFRDVRRFGGATLFAGPDELAVFFKEAGLGPEPFGVDPARWRRALAATKRCLKAVLLDQGVVAGVGNIYADEALFEARLHPARRADGLDARAAARLRRAVEAVLTRAIDKRGSSVRDYVGGSGQKGEYQKEFRVYRREGEPCPRCRTPVARARLAGRSSHYCPRCQPSFTAENAETAEERQEGRPAGRSRKG